MAEARSASSVLRSLAEGAGVFKGQSVLVVAPPGSGKTALGLEVAARRAEEGGRAAYLSPLRALASECYEKLKKMGVEAALATGDYHLPIRGGWGVLVSTFERFDSLWRRGEVAVDTAVVDEVHVLGEGRRGARLEGLLCRLRDEGVQVVALTATMGNPEEVAEWLGARLVKLDARQAPPKVLVCRDKNAEVARIAGEALASGKQVAVFVSTRRSAESLAARLAKSFSEGVVCYHHAGLPGPVRRSVEDSFRRGEVKVLVATTTLSAGVNVPADIVVVRDLTVYDQSSGPRYMDRNTFHQILGRAGGLRGGEAIVLCNSNTEKRLVMRTYFDGAAPVAKRVESKLGDFLDEQILVEVYRRGEATTRDLQGFLERTLWWRQKGSKSEKIKPLKTEERDGWIIGVFRAHRCRVNTETLKSTCTCNAPQPCPHVKATLEATGTQTTLTLTAARLKSQGFLERAEEKLHLTVLGALTVKLYLTCEAALTIKKLVWKCRKEEDVKKLAEKILRETGGGKSSDLPWALHCIQEIAKIEGAIDALTATKTPNQNTKTPHT
ncbi:MAG: DEAD/DEAH box helicase [Candidatus Jordarchaeales archaeon]